MTLPPVCKHLHTYTVTYKQNKLYNWRQHLNEDEILDFLVQVHPWRCTLQITNLLKQFAHLQ